MLDRSYRDLLSRFNNSSICRGRRACTSSAYFFDGRDGDIDNKNTYLGVGHDTNAPDTVRPR